LAQAAANRFLYNQREQLEIASRLALIYQYSALKLSPVQSDEMLDKVTIRAIPCWEVMLDRDATGSEDQRFIGHTYYLNMVEAKRKFGQKKFVAVPKENYFDEGGGPVSYTFYEKNILRTYWANAVRRDSRQYLYREGMVDEESLAKITAGVDGAMIAIDSDTLSGIIHACWSRTNLI
jgi:hypothetical protein